MNIKEKITVIRNEIIEEAKDKKEKMVEEKKDDLNKTYEVFREELERKRESILDSYRQEADMRREQIISRVALESKQELREVKQDCLDQLYYSIRDRLIEFQDADEYPDFLKRLISEALEVLNAGNVIYLTFNDKDREIYRSGVAEQLESEFPEKELKVREESAEINGGVIAESEDGRERVFNSFDSLLEEIINDMGSKLEEKFNDLTG